ncbi:MAG: helix-turn-helix domain-containing protein [Bryobacteraceae bacterium]|jgi:AraC family transcriptional regulator
MNNTNEPRTPSEAQIEANRRNAQKSTGPRTTEGKDASSRNRLLHGLRANKHILLDEDPAEFLLLVHDHLDRFQPVGPSEENLVLRIAADQWRLDRAIPMEAGIYRNRFHKVAQKDELRQNLYDIKVKYAAKEGKPAPPPFIPSDERDVLARAFDVDCEGANSIAKFARYQASIQHTIDRSLRQLQKYQAARHASTPDPGPEDSPGPSAPTAPGADTATTPSKNEKYHSNPKNEGNRGDRACRALHVPASPSPASPCPRVRVERPTSPCRRVPCRRARVAAPRVPASPCPRVSHAKETCGGIGASNPPLSFSPRRSAEGGTYMTIRNVGVFVFDGFSDWGPSYATAQLNNTFRVLTVAQAPLPVLTAGGLRIVPDLTLDALLPGNSALLILPDGASWELGNNREAARKAKEFLDAGIPVAAIGGATIGLARMGLLDDRVHTGTAAEELRRTGYNGEHLYRNQPAVTHKNLITASSSATMEFAREILAVLQPDSSAPPEPRSRRVMPDELRALVWSDPAGVTDSPASRKTIVSIHMGASVHIGCRRGGKYHCGLSVHGDIDIIPPNTPSRWELKEKDTSFIIRVPTSLLSEVADESGVDPSRVEIVNRFQMRDPQMEHIGWALKAEMDSGYRSGRLYLDSLGRAMAACLLDRHSSESRAARMHNLAMSGHRLRQVLSYIEFNFGRELSLKEIAGVAGVSVSHCNAAFRKAVGMPVHQYVIQRRVDHAKTLLAEGDLSISQIAAETGFAHQSHLAYHVRRLLGVSPLSLRQNHRRVGQVVNLRADC